MLDALLLQPFCDHENVSLSLFYGHSSYNWTDKIKTDESTTHLFIFISLKNFISEIVLNNIDHFITLKPNNTEYHLKK